MILTATILAHLHTRASNSRNKTKASNGNLRNKNPKILSEFNSNSSTVKMNGAKRFGASDSNLDSNKPIFQSKRLMVGSQFDSQRAEPSQLQSSEVPALDVRRAETSRQHVRALNKQFASWVQTQLQNHPDELWEDGVQDYLTHASNIKEKFSDIVNWLKANAARIESSVGVGPGTGPKKIGLENKNNEVKLFSESKNNEVKLFSDTTVPSTAAFTPSGSTVGFGLGNKNNEFKLFQEKTVTSTNLTSSMFTSPFAAQNKLVSESKDNELKMSPENTGASMATTPPVFTPSWSSGSLFNKQTPFSFGVQSSTPSNLVASNDADGDDEIEQPSSPSVKKTEEIGVTVVHEVKCKLYVKSTDPADKDTWKDKGAGQLSIKCKDGADKGTRDSKPTILVRNDVGRILLNALLYPGIKTSLQKNSIVAIFHTADASGDDSGTVVARTFLIRTKSEEDRNKLAAIIQEYAPAA